jgi:hypothetical protein
MNIKSRARNNVVEITITDSSTTINYDVWRNEAEQMKKQFQSVIDDIDWLVEKTEREKTKN